MILRRKIGWVAYPIIQILVIAAICGSFTIAAAQDKQSEKAFKESALLRKREGRAARDIDKYVTNLDRTARVLKRLGRSEGNDRGILFFVGKGERFDLGPGT